MHVVIMSSNKPLSGLEILWILIFWQHIVDIILFSKYCTPFCSLDVVVALSHSAFSTNLLQLGVGANLNTLHKKA